MIGALIYDSINNVYRLEIQIKLLRTGSYHINSGAEIRFIGNCNDYTISTNVQGWDLDMGKIEFEVKELEE